MDKLTARNVLLPLVVAWMLFPAFATAVPSEGNASEANTTEQHATTSATVSTHGEVTTGGERIRYRADAGTLLLHNKEDKPTGEMFYVAYFKDDPDSSHRPLTFLWNGGPGSSSGDLHIGAFGPVRVVAENATHTAPAPYRVVNNQYSLLDISDLVFVDAMGTGFSHILGKDAGGVGTPKDFYGIDSDAKAFAQFIVQFLSRYERWNSPKYLVGESYGTTRTAVVANLLEQDEGIDLNGLVLLSSNLNFDTSIDVANLNPGMNLPYALALPTYAAAASYHKVIPRPTAGLGSWLDEVEAWAMGPYLEALNAGSRLPQARKQRVAAQMAAYTGLPRSYILRANLRVTGPQFEHQLLLSRDESTGRMDTRFSGLTLDPLAENLEFDPGIAAISSAYISALNDYVRGTLHFGGEQHYEYLSLNINGQWNMLHTQPAQSAPAYMAPNVLPDLAAAMTINPDLRIMVNAGYFDLATPYCTAVYQMQQLPIAAMLEKNIEYRYYESGHMIYVVPQALGQLHDNIADFIRRSSGATSGD
jgi:carboxypeptidase C (cathepsin A)